MKDKKLKSDNLRSWKKGESGNPGGRPKLPDDVRKSRKLNRVELERVLNEFLCLTTPEMRSRVESSGATNIELIVGSLIAHAIANGDHHRLNCLLDRLLGRVQQGISIEPPAIPAVIYANRDGGMTSNGKEIDPNRTMLSPHATVVRNLDGGLMILGGIIPEDTDG